MVPHAVLLVFGVVDPQRRKTRLTADGAGASEGGGVCAAADARIGAGVTQSVAHSESFFDSVVQLHVRHLENSIHHVRGVWLYFDICRAFEHD